MIHLPAEVSHRRQRSTNTLDGAQVCVVKRVVAVESRITRTLRDPRPEVSACVDIATRNRIDQRRIIAPGSVGADIPQLDALQREMLGIFLRIAVVDIEVRVLAQEVIDANLHLAGPVLRGPSRDSGLTRRYVNLKPVQIHNADVKRLHEELADRGAEGEFLHRNDRIRCSGGHHVVRCEDAQARTRDSKSFGN